MIAKILNDIQINRVSQKTLSKKVATGDIFLGNDALNLGLVAEIGNITSSMEKSVQMTGLWKFMITPDMTDREKFFYVLF